MHVWILLALTYVIVFSWQIIESKDSKQQHRYYHNVNVKAPFDISTWGSYRPGSYFGMKQKIPPPNLISGIMWTTEGLAARNRIRHMVAADELEHFSWIRHDGRRYGSHEYRDFDGNTNIFATFAVDDEEASRAWMQRFEVKPQRRSQTLFMFYFGIDCDGVYTDENCLSVSEFRDFTLVERSQDDKHTKAALIGYSKNSGYFCLEINMYYTPEPTEELPPDPYADDMDDDVEDDDEVEITPQIPKLSYWSVARGYTASSAVNVFKSEAMRYMSVKRQQSQQQQQRDRSYDIYNNELDLMNPKIDPDTGNIVFQVRASDSFRLETTLHENIVVSSIDELAEKVSDTDSGSFATSSDEMSHVFRQYETKFEEKFNAVFNKNGAEREEYKELARRSLSNLLGGLGHFYGTPKVNNVETSAIEPIELYTATPSRTSFPRGFLWDEGFHQALILEWDIDITLQVLAHWISALYFVDEPDSMAFRGGWIPREVILGRESNRRVPSEFVSQSPVIGNPPTLLLVVETLIDRYGIDGTHSDEKVCSASRREEIMSFVRDLFMPLHHWFIWFATTQITPQSFKRSVLPFPGGPTGISFSWRGRAMDDRKLNANTFASGLDDYPRSMLTSDQERHVDLASWMARAADIMSKLQDQIETYDATILKKDRQTVMSDITYLFELGGIEDKYSNATYNILTEHLKSQVERVHWSEQYKAYLDIGPHDPNFRIESEVLIRCKNERDQTTIDVGTNIEEFKKQKVSCPHSHPQYLYPMSDPSGQNPVAIVEKLKTDLLSLPLQHVKHIGYVSMFPFMLQLVDPTSNRLSTVLNFLQAPEHLWTNYGLRSLSSQDPYYRRRNAVGDAPYWRAPIWININYLALRALKYYSSVEGPEKKRCKKLYTSLRENVLETVRAEFENSGDLWEHYDDIAGVGTRGHPFAGWTSLIVNILYELW